MQLCFLCSVVTKALSLVPETEAKIKAPGLEAKNEAAASETEAVDPEIEAVDPETEAKAARQLIVIPINIK